MEKMQNEKTLLIIVPESTVMEDSVFFLLVAKTGECLASHLCSHAGYAKSDLYSGRPERKKEYAERFREVEVRFINETDISNDEILKRNKKWYDENKEEE